MTPPPYSVVIVTWQSAGHLRALIASMNRHLLQRPELVVIDNASDDDPARELGAWQGPSSFFALESNAGFGAAANKGVESAAGDPVVLLNPDTELVDSSLDQLAALAKERRAIVGPRVLNADGSLQPSASGAPVGIWPWIGAVVPGAVAPPPLRARTEPWRCEGETTVAWLTGSCLAAPRDVLRELGPFDSAIHLYGEDMDLGLRAADSGIPSIFAPGRCRIVHRGKASTALRYADRGAALTAANRRAVVRRAYGAHRELLSWLALRVNLRLRVLAKQAIRRDSARDRQALAAVAATRRVPDLSANR